MVSSKSIITNSFLVDCFGRCFDLLFWSTTACTCFSCCLSFLPSCHSMLHVLNVLNKVLFVDCWVHFFEFQLDWLIVVLKLAFDEMLYSVFVLLLDWLLHVFMRKRSSSLSLHCFCRYCHHCWCCGNHISSHCFHKGWHCHHCCCSLCTPINAVAFVLSLPQYTQYKTPHCCCCHTSWLLCLGDVMEWVSVDLSINVISRENVNAAI